MSDSTIEQNPTNQISLETVVQWCNFIPKEELVSLLKRIYSSRQKLADDYEKVANKSIQMSISKYLDRYAVTDHIVRLLIGKMSEDLISSLSSLFIEYKYGSNPSFYFLEFSPSINSLTKDDFVTGITNAIEEFNQEKNEDIFPSVRNLELVNSSQDQDTIEIEFHFEKIFTYVDPEDLMPKSIYIHDNAVIWIQKKISKYIIMTNHGPIIRIIKELISASMELESRSIRLTKTMVDVLFNQDTIVSATFDEDIQDPRAVEKITLTDRNLHTKSDFSSENRSRDRMRSFHRFEFLTTDRSAYIKREGKLSVSGKFKKTEIKQEALVFLFKIEQYYTEIKENNPLEFLRFSDPDDLVSLNFINTKKGKDKIALYFQNLTKLILFDPNETVYAQNPLEIKRLISDHFLLYINGQCSETDCIERIICNQCNQELEFNLTKAKLRSDRLQCDQCGYWLETSLEVTFSCNHENIGTLRSRLVLVLTQSGRLVYQGFMKEHGYDTTIPSNTQVVLRTNILELRTSTFNHLVELNEIEYFSSIPPIEELSPYVIKQQSSIVDFELKEKCPNHGTETCRSCLVEYHGNCVQRVIAQFCNGVLRPHSPVEYGDFNFALEYEGVSYTVIGIAKSGQGRIHKTTGEYLKKTVKPLTPSKDERILSQVLDAVMFKGANFIMIASGATIEVMLKEMIDEICKLFQVKLVYFTREDLIRAYPSYIDIVKERYEGYKQIF